MSATLPQTPNLDFLKKQAKELQKGHRGASPEVCASLRQYLPRFAAHSDNQILAAALSLHDAQHVIARQYGFYNWTALREEVAQRVSTAGKAPPKRRCGKIPKLADLDPKLCHHIETLGFSTLGGYRVWCHHQGLGSDLDKSEAQLAAERERARQLGGNLEPQVSRSYRRGQAEAIQQAYEGKTDPDRPWGWLPQLFAATADPGERQALRTLLLQVEKYTLIRWETAAPLASHYRQWRRPVEQFYPKGEGRADQLIELTQYLLGRDEVPDLPEVVVQANLDPAVAVEKALAAGGPKVLTPDEVLSFMERGYVYLRQAFPSAAALEMREFMWAELKRLHGIERDEPSTWTINGRHSGKIQPGDFKLNSSRDNPVYAPIASERFMDAYAQLAGREAARLRKNGGGFLISFPENHDQPWTLRANKWHIDFGPQPGRYGLIPPGLQTFKFFSEVDPGGGGTLIVAGSHRLALKFFQSLGSLDLELKKSLLDNRFSRSHAWLAELTDKAPDQGERIRRFMEEGSTIDGVPVKVVELTGEPGDVVLCHPAIFHCRSFNCSKVPRFMRT